MLKNKCGACTSGFQQSQVAFPLQWHFICAMGRPSGLKSSSQRAYKWRPAKGMLQPQQIDHLLPPGPTQPRTTRAPSYLGGLAALCLFAGRIFWLLRRKRRSTRHRPINTPVYQCEMKLGTPGMECNSRPELTGHTILPEADGKPRVEPGDRNHHEPDTQGQGRCLDWLSGGIAEAWICRGTFKSLFSFLKVNLICLRGYIEETYTLLPMHDIPYRSPPPTSPRRNLTSSVRWLHVRNRKVKASTQAMIDTKVYSDWVSLMARMSTSVEEEDLCYRGSSVVRRRPRISPSSGSRR